MKIVHHNLYSLWMLCMSNYLLGLGMATFAMADLPCWVTWTILGIATFSFVGSCCVVRAIDSALAAATPETKKKASP
jgi:hypothetical protein